MSGLRIDQAETGPERVTTGRGHKVDSVVSKQNNPFLQFPEALRRRNPYSTCAGGLLQVQPGKFSQ